MGQARKRGSYEERMNAARERTAPEREIVMDSVKLEFEGFSAVQRIMMALATESVAEGRQADFSAMKGYRQPDGTLYVRAEFGGRVMDATIPPGQWRSLDREEYETIRHKLELLEENDPGKFQSLRDELAARISLGAGIAEALWEERSRRTSVASALGVVLDRTEAGLAAADMMRSRFPEAADILDGWEDSDDGYFVYVRDKFEIELVARSVPDLRSLLDEVLPSLFEHELAAEVYCDLVPAVDRSVLSEVERRLEELNPFPEVLLDPEAREGSGVMVRAPRPRA